MDERSDIPVEESNVDSDDLSLFFGAAKDVIARYTHCGVCGANLHFSYVTDFSRNVTQETARCPECSTKIRQIIHRLQ